MPLHGKQSEDPTKVQVLQEYTLGGKLVQRPKWVDKKNEFKYKPLPAGWKTQDEMKASGMKAPEKVLSQQMESGSFETDNPKRLHQHTWVNDQGETKLIEHPVGHKHKDDLSSIEHRDEMVKHGRKANKGEQLPEHWTDKLGVKMSSAKVHHGNISYMADKYSHSGVGDFYVTETPYDTVVFSPQKNVTKRFVKPHEAFAFVQQQFEGAIHKSLILMKMEALMKASDGQKVQANYVSGDTKIELTGNGQSYEVRVNDGNMLKTDSFQEAIRKYYREISKIIEAQSEDKDVGLELLGEKIVMNNRNIMQQMANMGKSTEAKWLKSWDFSKSIFDVIELRKGPDLNSMPLPEEQDSADDSGSKPTRQLGVQPRREEDLDHQEKNPIRGYHSQKTKMAKEQEPITMNSIMAKMSKVFSKDFPNMTEGGRSEGIPMEGKPNNQEVICGKPNG